jgi:hypothetical protein
MLEYAALSLCGLRYACETSQDLVLEYAPPWIVTCVLRGRPCKTSPRLVLFRLGAWSIGGWKLGAMFVVRLWRRKAVPEHLGPRSCLFTS